MNTDFGITEVYVEQTGEKGEPLIKIGYAMTYEGHVILTRNGKANWSFDRKEVEERVKALEEDNNDE